MKVFSLFAGLVGLVASTCTNETPAFSFKGRATTTVCYPSHSHLDSKCPVG